MNTKLFQNDFTRIEFPDSVANNFLFDMKLFLQDRGCKFNLFKDWTNKKHNILLIEFVFEDRTSVDWLEVFLNRELLDNNIDFGFEKEFVETFGVGTRNVRTFKKNFQSLGKSGVLLIDLSKHKIYTKKSA